MKKKKEMKERHKREDLEKVEKGVEMLSPRDDPRVLKWNGDAPTVTDECSVLVAMFQELNWDEFYKQLRLSAAQFGIEITGHVKVTMSYAWLPINFESAWGASQPRQIRPADNSEISVSVHRGVQDSDVERFKVFLAGDTTVEGKKIGVYAEGSRRDPVDLSGSNSIKKLRMFGRRSANLNGKEGAFGIIIALENGPGAAWRLDYVGSTLYY